MITYYTDGSCSPNPGKGGRAYIKFINGQEIKVGGTKHNTTNNEMELMALMQALYNACTHTNEQVIIYSDSQRAVNMINSKWKPKKHVADIKAMQALIKLNKHITLSWVKGHSTSDSNNKVDRLARHYSML